MHTLDSCVTADDDLANQETPFVLKLDVQGFEGAVLDGARSSLRRIPVIMIEMSLVPLYEGAASFEELYSRLTQQGYTCVGLYPGFTDPKTMKMLQVDGIFERDN